MYIFNFIDDENISCGDLLSYFIDAHYYMEFINCILEGQNNECKCQKQQDKALGIDRKCFDYSSPPSPPSPHSPPSGTSTALMVNWILQICQLFFLVLI